MEGVSTGIAAWFQFTRRPPTPARRRSIASVIASAARPSCRSFQPARPLFPVAINGDLWRPVRIGIKLEQWRPVGIRFIGLAREARRIRLIPGTVVHGHLRIRAERAAERGTLARSVIVELGCDDLRRRNPLVDPGIQCIHHIMGGVERSPGGLVSAAEHIRPGPAATMVHSRHHEQAGEGLRVAECRLIGGPQ